MGINNKYTPAQRKVTQRIEQINLNIRRLKKIFIDKIIMFELEKRKLEQEVNK